MAKGSKVKQQAAQLGLGTLVTGLKAIEGSVSKKKYKRLIATAVAQLLTMHPDFKPGQARRRAAKITGSKPSKKMLVKPGKAGLKETLGTAAVAAAGGAALKIAGKLSRRVTDKVREVAEAQPAESPPARQAQP